MANNVVDAAQFLKRREDMDAGKVINALNLTGNKFKGNIIIEQTFQSYVCKVVCNFNNKVIIVKEEFSIYDGIDLEELTARVAEELAIHFVIDSLKTAMKTDKRIKGWVKKGQFK